ncbi:hypothetical protein [Aeromonas dhakensis]|uniref:hypothetical protein n=1 Tax=Aeromonas dhakensis TaxID=196024 RepID=UPI0012FDC22C|nr:hypothetical protein [Aeromonas dhakensis]
MKNKGSNVLTDKAAELQKLFEIERDEKIKRAIEEYNKDNGMFDDLVAATFKTEDENLLDQRIQLSTVLVDAMLQVRAAKYGE